MAKGLVSILLAVVAFGTLVARSAMAVEEELLEQARAQFAEARPFVQKANDVDLDMSQRQTPRREAFKRLKEARGLYDRYLDANPSMEEKLDKEYVEMMVLLHGIKKDSALGELEKDEDASPPPPATGPGPSTGPAPSDPAARAKQAIAAVRAFETAHPGDVPQIQKLYTRFLAEFPNPSLPEYGDAVERLGQVTERIKRVFQDSAKRDFDALSGKETKDERTLVSNLEQGLSSNDGVVRRRAATLLAGTRLRSAVRALARFLTDPDAEFARICRDGLVAIGGTSAGESMVNLYRDGPRDRQLAGMGVLRTLVAKGDAEAANQSRSIGKFTLASEGAVAAEAFKLLVSMGPRGGRGLTVAVLELRDIDKKCYAISQMAEAKHHPGAALLAESFLVEPKGDPVAAQLHNAAAAAIEKMGVPAIPYLIEAMRGRAARGAARVASAITGLTLTPEDVEKLRVWWADHKPAEEK